MNEGKKVGRIPCWPLKHGKEQLTELALDEVMFNMGYRLNAVNPGDLKFPSVQKCYAKGVVLGELLRRQLPAYIGVDLAGDKRPGNAIAVVGLDPISHRRYLLEIKFGAWTSPQLAGVLADVCTRHNVQFIQVENNAYQQSLIDWIRKEKPDFPFWMKIKAFTTGKNKADPNYGLPALEVEFSNDAWVFPHSEWEFHPSTCKCDWCRLSLELRLYPKGGSSDGVMACVGEGARITTARGLLPIEQVVVGDMVLTHRARWRRVSEVFERHFNGEAIAVKPGGRAEFIVTPEHPIWSAGARFFREDRTNRLVPSVWAFTCASDLRVGRKTAGDYVFVPDVPAEWPGGDAALPRPPGFLVGLYLAEGYLSGNPHQVGFAFHERETYLVEYVMRCARDVYGVRAGVDHKNEKCLAVRFNSKEAVADFAMFGKHQTKAMPWSMMSAPLAFREQVVRGWLVGDGNLYDGRLMGVSISKDLLAQVQITLAQMGYPSTIAVHEKGGVKSVFANGPSLLQKSWRVALSRSDSADFASGAGPEEIARWGAHFTPWRDRTNSQSLETPDGFAVRLRGLDRVPYVGVVRNLHVEEDESYVVEGVAVHNCWFARDAANKWAPRGVSTGGFGGLNTR